MKTLLFQLCGSPRPYSSPAATVKRVLLTAMDVQEQDKTTQGEIEQSYDIHIEQWKGRTVEVGPKRVPLAYWRVEVTQNDGPLTLEDLWEVLKNPCHPLSFDGPLALPLNPVIAEEGEDIKEKKLSAFKAGHPAHGMLRDAFCPTSMM